MIRLGTVIKQFVTFMKVIGNFIGEEIFPFICCSIATRKLQKKIEILKESGVLPYNLTQFANLETEVIMLYHEKEIERKKIVEEKAKANILGITLAVTLFLAASDKFVRRDSIFVVLNGYIKQVLILLYIAAFFYFLYAGYAALKAMRVGVLWDIYLSDELEIGQNEHNRRNYLIRCLNLNQLATNIRANYLNASYLAIRNGLFTLVGFLVLLVVIMI